MSQAPGCQPLETRLTRNCPSRLPALTFRSGLRYRRADQPPAAFDRLSRPLAAQRPATATEAAAENLQKFKTLFQKWDSDGDNALDKRQFYELLQQVTAGLHSFTLEWLKEVDLQDVVFFYDVNKDGKISYDEFDILIQDCSIIEGKLTEYKQAFDAIDTSGDGTLNAGELTALFEALRQPIKSEKLARLMETVDRDMNGSLDFFEFLGLFRNELLELRALEDFVRLRKSRPKREGQGKLIEATPGKVQMLFSEAEFDHLLHNHAHQLIVLEAGLTWCRPCKGFERTYQKFAEYYDQALFLHFYGNSNETCRNLFTNRIHASATPDFSFHREGKMLSQFSGANAGKLNQAMQTHLQDGENPLAGATQFQRQVWNSTIGIH